MRALRFLFLNISKALFITLLIISPSFAQWHYSHYDIYPNIMRDCAAVDSNTFWAVGSFGYVIKSTDSGRTWSPFSYAHLTDALYEVSFPDAKHGFAASGPTGSTTIIATIDSGNTWYIAHSQLPLEWISGLEFADSLNGFVSGINTLYRTTDGGYNWFEPDSFIPGFITLDMYLSNRDTVWACGATGIDPYTPMIIKTVDGGHSWHTISTIGDTLDGWIRTIEFSDNMHGWVTLSLTHAYPCFLYATSDGGMSWQLIYVFDDHTTINNYDFIVAFDSLNLRITGVIGSTAKLLCSADGGFNWQEEFSGYVGDIEGFSMPDSTHGLIVGGPIYDNTPLLLYYDTADAIEDGHDQLPSTFKISEGYPNPFNSSCSWIADDIPDEVAIYNVLGSLIIRIKPSSNHIIWDGANSFGTGCSSGVYFSAFRKGGNTVIKRVVKLN